MKHPSETGIKVRDIREDRALSKIYRWELMLQRQSVNPEVDVELLVGFLNSTESDSVKVRLGALFTGMRGQIRRRLLDYYIEADFRVDTLEFAGLNEASEFREVMLTSEALRLMLSITLGALRGMLALRTAGTLLADYPLPIYNLDELTEKLVVSSATFET